MSTLVITRGVPGSGKTTWAKERSGFIPISRDDIRRELYTERGQDYYAAEDLKAREEKITAIQHKRISTLLGAGFDVIVHDTNLPVRRCRELMRLAEEAGAKFDCVEFDLIELETCINRQANRPVDEQVPAEVITRMYNQYVRGGLSPLPPVSGLSPKTHDYSQVVPVVPDDTLPDAYVWDLDGTLALMNGRGPHDYHRVGTDQVNENVRGVLWGLSGDFSTSSNILVSGRKDSCRAETEAWLRREGIPYAALYMRPSDDNRVDWQIKYELFNEHIRGKYNVLGCFDDRRQVVELWRKMGLTCFAVADGDF